MVKEILQDENAYEGGKRVNTQRIVTTYSKADDILLLAQDVQTLGHLEADIERLEARITEEKDEGMRRGLRVEVERQKGDTVIMRKKIKLQQCYVDGYDDPERDEQEKKALS